MGIKKYFYLAAYNGNKLWSQNRELAGFHRLFDSTAGAAHTAVACYGERWGSLQLPLWSSDQRTEAWVVLPSWNTAQWRRTWHPCGRRMLLTCCSLLFRESHTKKKKPLQTLILKSVLLNLIIDELKEKLEDFVSQTNSQRPGFIKVVRHSRQEGLIRSRVSGWRAATAPVVALFDAHVEFNIGWWVTHKESFIMLTLNGTVESYHRVGLNKVI